MFSTGLVSVTWGRESNVLRQRENKTLNTPTGKGKLKKRARSYFSFSKTKYSLHPKLHFAGRSKSEFQNLAEGTISLLTGAGSPVCSPECHPVNARQSLCFQLLSKSAPMLKTGEAKNTRVGREMWS